LKDGIAPGLRAKLDGSVRAVSRDKAKRFLRNKFGPDFAWERAEVDVVPEGGQEFPESMGTWLSSIRSIGKGIRGDKPGIPVPGGVMYDACHAPVAHDRSEYPRGLAVGARERASPRDLDVSFHPRKGRVGIEDDARCRGTIGFAGSYTRERDRLMVPYTRKECRDKILPLPDHYVIGISGDLTPAGGSMGPSCNGDAVCFRDFRRKIADIQGIETVAGDIVPGTIRWFEEEAFPLAGSIECGICIPCRSGIPPIHLHIRLPGNKKEDNPGITPWNGRGGADR